MAWPILLAQPRGRARTRDQVAVWVRVLLAENGDGYPDLATIAAMLCVSERTFKRRLQEYGCTYRQLRNEARLRDSRRLLADTGLCIEAIATHLGYASAANFSRAFRRWTGVPPGSYRRALR